MKYLQKILLALAAIATKTIAFVPVSPKAIFPPTTSSTIPLSATIEETDTTTSTPAADNDSQAKNEAEEIIQGKLEDLLSDKFMKEIELETDRTVDEMIDEECEVDEVTGGPQDEICLDDEKKEKTKSGLRRAFRQTFQILRGSTKTAEAELIEEFGADEVFEGDILERGWEMRGDSSAIVRNVEITKFALKAVFSALKPRKMKAQGASEEEIKAAQVQAAEFIRDNLLKLGPSFVKVEY